MFFFWPRSLGKWCNLRHVSNGWASPAPKNLPRLCCPWNHDGIMWHVACRLKFVKVLQKTILRGHTKWWARSCWNDACYTVLFYCWKSIISAERHMWLKGYGISNLVVMSFCVRITRWIPISTNRRFLQQGHNIVSRRSWGMLETSYYPPTAAMVSSESFGWLLHTSLAASPKSTS